MTRQQPRPYDDGIADAAAPDRGPVDVTAISFSNADSSASGQPGVAGHAPVAVPVAPKRSATEDEAGRPLFRQPPEAS